MPLYKLFCIAAHYPEYRHIKDLVSSSARFLLDQGGVVREVRYLGLRNLPQTMKRHKQKHTIGDYWHMNFDASPFVLNQLSDRMRTDHRVVRWTMLKLAEKLEDVADEQTRLTSTVSYPDNMPRKSEFLTQATLLPGTGAGGWSMGGEVASLNGALGEPVDVTQFGFEKDRISQLGSTPYARGPIPEN